MNRSKIETWRVSPTSVAYTWTRRHADGRLCAYSVLLTDVKVVWSGYVWDGDGWSLISRFPFSSLPLGTPLAQALIYRAYSVSSPV